MDRGHTREHTQATTRDLTWFGKLPMSTGSGFTILNKEELQHSPNNSLSLYSLSLAHLTVLNSALTLSIYTHYRGGREAFKWAGCQPTFLLSVAFFTRPTHLCWLASMEKRSHGQPCMASWQAESLANLQHLDHNWWDNEFLEFFWPFNHHRLNARGDWCTTTRSKK